MKEKQELLALRGEVQKLKSELAQERSRFQSLADYFNCGMWEYHVGTRTMEYSHHFDSKGNYKWNVIRDFPKWAKSHSVVHPEDMSVFEAFCECMENGEEAYEFDIRMMLLDGKQFRWIRFAGNSMVDGAGNCYKAVGKLVDITEERKERASLQKQAMQDPLTGLYNKVTTKNLIMEKLSQYEYGAEKWAYMIIDVDNFKGINDRYGHLCGDRMLTGFAGILKSCFRKEDILGRIGGDEFVVFCHNVETEDEAAVIAQKIIDHTYDLDMGDGETLTVSIGVSLFPRDARSYNTLYNSADLALYQAKWAGKNCYSIFQKNQQFSISKKREEKKRLESQKPSEMLLKTPDEKEKSLFDFSFGIINRTEDFFEAATTIFKETGQLLHLDDISLIMYEYEERKTSLLACWLRETCTENEQKNELLAKLYEENWEIVENRYEKEAFYCYQKDENKEDPFYQHAFFKNSTIQSAIQFPVFDGLQLIGVVSFADAKMRREWSNVEYSVLSSISKMIESYMVRMNVKKEKEEEIFYNEYVAENQKLTYYSIDINTHELLYASRYAEETFPGIHRGEKCYKTVMGRNEPCENCPVAEMLEGGDRKKYVTEIYHEEKDAWYTAAVTELKHNSHREYLLCWKDVTNFLERVKARDRLTGVYSYDKFRMEVLKRMINRSVQYAVFSIGIKDFSNINENFGYETGDEILKQMAERFQDAMVEDELVCRIKGDDFFLFLRAEEYNEMLERVSRILNSVKNLLSERYEDLPYKCNCGIYYIKREDHSVSRILDRANKARKVAMNLYSDEHSYFLYSREFEEQMLEERKLEMDMLKALREKEFQIYLQPKVNLRSGKICGGEALVRWVKKNGDVLLPDRFIPLFERNRFVLQIDDYVYRSLFVKMKEWLSQGKNVPVISVNVSRLHLLNDGFPEHFCEMVDWYEIPHHIIELEVTESAFVENTQVLIEMTTRLREMGFLISMDDFGTGYSSLNFVKMLPIDILKIDGSFFKDNQLDEKNKAVISSVLQLARNMDLKIVSEGIETEEQVDYLLEEECDIAQGYFYYKPMTMDEFGKLIENE